jgi:hypothetical protein
MSEATSAETTVWFIRQTATGHCEICGETVEGRGDLTPESALADSAGHRRWGPFDSRETAIARRVGLIRAGKCKAQ